jgi:broad specificity phosphatase PhoE
MSMPVNLFVVRHGESLGNLAKRCSERGDNGLEELYDHASSVAVDWTAIKRRTYDSHELLVMSGKMSKDLRDYV